MGDAQKRRRARLHRHRRVRKTVTGTPERPRLNVFRSLEHIYAQIIDDSAGHTLVSASTLDKEVRGLCGEAAMEAGKAAKEAGKAAKEAGEAAKKVDEAKVVGRVLAKRALARGVNEVVFDRGGYQYHGRVKALADGAREGGLGF